MKYDELIQILLGAKSGLDKYLLSDFTVGGPWPNFVVVLVGAYAICMVALQLYEWYGAIQYFGCSAFNYRHILIRIKIRESIMRKISLHYMLPACIALLALYKWHLTDENHYVALFLLFFALMIMSPYLWPIPPVVLYLATSRPQRSQFRGILWNRIMPARIATLLHPKIFRFMADVWAYEDYRTRETAAWEESVTTLASIVRAIVLDGRDYSIALEQEALWMLNPKYSPKLFVLTGPGGRSPLVDRLSEVNPQMRDLLSSKCISESRLYQTIRGMKRFGSRANTFWSMIGQKELNIDDLAERCAIRSDEIYRYLKLVKWAHSLHKKELNKSKMSTFGSELTMMLEIDKIVKCKLDCGVPNTDQAYREIDDDVDRLFALLVENGHLDLTEDVAEEVAAIINRTTRVWQVTSQK